MASLYSEVEGWWGVVGRRKLQGERLRHSLQNHGHVRCRGSSGLGQVTLWNAARGFIPGPPRPPLCLRSLWLHDDTEPLSQPDSWSGRQEPGPRLARMFLDSDPYLDCPIKSSRPEESGLLAPALHFPLPPWLGPYSGDSEGKNSRSSSCRARQENGLGPCSGAPDLSAALVTFILRLTLLSREAALPAQTYTLDCM